MNVHAGKIQAETLSQLQSQLCEAQVQADRANALVDEIKARIEARVAAEVAELRRLQNKETGVVNCEMEGFKVKHSVPKNISWDTKKLMDVARSLAEGGSDPYALIECKLTIPEKKFEALTGALRNAVLEARTEKHGKVKIELEAVE